MYIGQIDGVRVIDWFANSQKVLPSIQSETSCAFDRRTSRKSGRGISMIEKNGNDCKRPK